MSGGLMRDVFFELVEAEPAGFVPRSDPGRVIVVTEEMRAADAESQRLRERVETGALAWKIKAELSVENLKAAKRPKVIVPAPAAFVKVFRPQGGRRAGSGKPQRLTPCEGCGEVLGVKGMQWHRPRCEKRPGGVSPRVGVGGRKAGAKATELSATAVAAGIVLDPMERIVPAPPPVKRLGGLRKMRPCEWCKAEFSFTGMRAHIPHCEKRPAGGLGRRMRALTEAEAHDLREVYEGRLDTGTPRRSLQAFADARPGLTRTSCEKLARELGLEWKKLATAKPAACKCGRRKLKVRDLCTYCLRLEEEKPLRVECAETDCVRKVRRGKLARGDGRCGLCGADHDRRVLSSPMATILVARDPEELEADQVWAKLNVADKWALLMAGSGAGGGA